MIIFLFGADTYRSTQKLKELKEKFLREVDPLGMNLITLDGGNLTMDMFHSAVSSVSFLARKRMVVVYDLMRKSRSSPIFHDILEVLSHKTDDTTILIFWESKPNARNPLFQFLKKQKYAYEFPFLDQRGREAWIVQRVAALHAKIETSAVVLLSAYVGSDLYVLENEIQKLVAHARGGVITQNAVEEMVSAQFDDVVFHFIDALCARDGRAAYRLFHEQLASGANELYLLTMITRQIRILLMVKDFQDTTNRFEIAKKLSLHPFVVQKSLGFAHKFTVSELKKMYFQLMQIDYAIKTGEADFSASFDLFLAKYVS